MVVGNRGPQSCQRAAGPPGLQDDSRGSGKGQCQSAAAKRRAARARALIASSSRSRGGADVTRESMSFRAISETSSTARSNAAWFAFEGLVKPLSFLTNCTDAARTSSSVAGGSKLNSVLMFLHIALLAFVCLDDRLSFHDTGSRHGSFLRREAEVRSGKWIPRHRDEVEDRKRCGSPQAACSSSTVAAKTATPMRPTSPAAMKGARGATAQSNPPSAAAGVMARLRAR